MFDPSDTTTTPRLAVPTSRRRFLAGGLAAGTAMTASGLVATRSAASADTQEFNAPGKALEAAQRIGVQPIVDDFVVPTDGEILFPIVVGAEDNVYLFSNSFGACRSGCTRSHEGVDIMAGPGLPVRAVAGGVLTKQYVDSGKTYGAGHGWTLFSADTNITWKFFHLDRHENGLEVGDEVEIGQVIGYVGNTGTSGANSKSNYHLHFEYRPGNIARNSYDLLQRDANVTFY